MNSNPARTYTNVALTIIAGLLAINTFDHARSGFAAEALAQPTTVRNVPAGASPSSEAPESNDHQTAGLVNPDEQRNRILTEVRAIGTRLDRVESILRTGLSVKVTELPPGFGAEKGAKPERAEKADKPAPTPAGQHG